MIKSKKLSEIPIDIQAALPELEELTAIYERKR